MEHYEQDTGDPQTVRRATQPVTTDFQSAMKAPRHRPEDDENGPLIVKAKADGFYGTRRREGARFTLKKREDFSHRWMVAEGWKPDAPKPRVTKAKPAAAGATGTVDPAHDARLAGLEARVKELEASKQALEDTLVEKLKEFDAEITAKFKELGEKIGAKK